MGKSFEKRTVSASELISVVNGVRCCKFCQVSYVSPIESVNKKLIGGRKNEYYNEVSTVSSMNGVQVNANYQNAVNNRIEDGGEKFVAESLPWGTWLTPNKLIEHNGKVYLRLYMTKSTTTDKTYYRNGVACDCETAKAIASTMRESKPSARQAEVGIEVADMVKPFTVCLDNLLQFTVDGVIYTVAHTV